MQTLGPSGAMLYFARLLPGGSRYGLHGARTRVDERGNLQFRDGETWHDAIPFGIYVNLQQDFQVYVDAGFDTRVLLEHCAGVAPDTTEAALEEMTAAGIALI